MKLTKTTKTYNSTNTEQKWILINAENKTLGRISTAIADILRGKHKPQFTPNTDCGDYVVVVNAEKIKVTGNKMQDKMYYHHTGYIGGIREINMEKLLEKHPGEVLIHSVKGMLPKNKLSDKLISKLKVYKGESHPHQAQKPILLEEMN